MRTFKGAARRQAKRRLFKKAKGFVGGRRHLYRTAKETLVRAGVFAYRDRRNRRRTLRRQKLRHPRPALLRPARRPCQGWCLL